MQQTSPTLAAAVPAAVAGRSLCPALRGAVQHCRERRQWINCDGRGKCSWRRYAGEGRCEVEVVVVETAAVTQRWGKDSCGGVSWVRERGYGGGGRRRISHLF